MFSSIGLPFEARVTLKGHAIFGTIESQPAWLDGQCFGVNGGLRSDGVTPRIDLNLSAGVRSGNGAKASDFESWFQLRRTPFLELDIFPANIQLEAGVTAPPVQGLVSLDSLGATPMSAGATITVALASSNGSAASCPSSIALEVAPNGTTSTGTFAISLVGPPSNGDTLAVTFTAMAQLPSTYAATSSATLTIVGPPTQPLTLTISPNQVAPNASVKGTITLGTASTASTGVTLTCSAKGVSFPPTVSIPAGSTSATFTITNNNGGGGPGLAATFTAVEAQFTSTAVLTLIGGG